MKRVFSGWKYAVIIVGLAVLAMLIMDFNSRMAEWRRLEVQRDQVATQLSHRESTQSALQTEIAYSTSEAGVIEWAYEEGHWVRKGDTLVVPISPPDFTPEQSPTPVVTPRVVKNWELWLSLFIDRLP